jgi:hypothetical protein
MALLAIQFGLQPILTRNFAAPGINKSTVILTQEFVKFGLAFMMLNLSGGREKALKGTFIVFITLYTTDWLEIDWRKVRQSSSSLLIHTYIITQSSMIHRLEYSKLDICGRYSGRIVRHSEFSSTEGVSKPRRSYV